METNNSKRVELFWNKVEKLDNHWLWTGALDSNGYGNFTVAKGKTNKAHIYSYVLNYGPIPFGKQVDHVCEIRNCVKCLQLLSGKKNRGKSVSPSAINKRKTHCTMGHRYDEYNTIKDNGRRRCRTCEIERGRI